MSMLTTLFGDPNEKTLKEFKPFVERINGLAEQFTVRSHDDLKAATTDFKRRLAGGETLDDILPEAFAAVREAATRTLKQRHFDVQLLGGIALHRGAIAEMRTGEGKTLTSTLAVYLNALENKGVHVVTVNDYLARRDAVWMGQVYHALGMSIGIIQHQGVSFVYDPSVTGEERDQDSERDNERDSSGSFKVEHSYLRSVARKEAYACDITYGTNNEFGFDYLRDNMAQSLEQCVQRGHEYAIVDEVDSILIDEARTPLIISAPAAEATQRYYEFARLVRTLNVGQDYNVDEKMRAATLTDEGIRKMEQALGMDNVYTEGGIAMVHHIEQALKAHALFARDKEYVVENNEVVIVDEFTGRKMPGRRYSEGLHQALEAKENLPIQRESQTLATITFQNYFRLYKKLAGMTGTAATEAEEFGKIYGLDVVVIPTNKHSQRIDHSDRIYRSEQAKQKAVVARVKEAQTKGQPVLLGTISIEKNEEYSILLTREGVTHEVLNAKNHEREGEIIAQAGRPGAVTLATNMAGRGVDIILGGNPPVADATQRVREAGGLLVVGTERHESRRIDNQLRGRAGRQGDPGETQFFVSVEDSLMRIFAGDRMKSMMSALKLPDEVPIENRIVTRALEQAQKKVEGHNFDIRKHLLEYDDVLNKHREAVYRQRYRILLLDAKKQVSQDGPQSLKDMICEMVFAEIQQVVTFHTANGNGGDWNPKEIIESCSTIFSVDEAVRTEIERLDNERANHDEVEIRTKIITLLEEQARSRYHELERHIVNHDLLHAIERSVLLRAYDTLWVEHLVSMSHLRTGIGLRGYGQRDPLIEYKREAFRMFNALQDAITKEVAYSFYKVGFAAQAQAQALVRQGSVFDRRDITLSGAQKTMASGNSLAAGAGRVVDIVSPVQPKERNQQGEKVGRNDPCLCGSGKKYKQCHGG